MKYAIIIPVGNDILNNNYINMIKKRLFIETDGGCEHWRGMFADEKNMILFMGEQADAAVPILRHLCFVSLVFL